MSAPGDRWDCYREKADFGGHLVTGGADISANDGAAVLWCRGFSSRRGESRRQCWSRRPCRPWRRGHGGRFVGPPVGVGECGNGVAEAVVEAAGSLLGAG